MLRGTTNDRSYQLWCNLPTNCTLIHDSRLLVSAFKIDIPTEKDFWKEQPHISPVHCQGLTTDEICYGFNAAFRHITLLQTQSSGMIKTDIAQIKNLIPTQILAIDPDSRQERALFGHFVADAASYLFGTPKPADIKKLKQSVQALSDRMEAVSTIVIDQQAQMTSFMTATDTRINGVVKSIQANHFGLEWLRNNTQVQFGIMSAFYSELSILLSEFARMSSLINREMDRFHNSIMDLMEGKLSPHLFPVATLRDVLQNIQTHLTLMNTQFTVAIMDPRYYYQHAEYIIHRQHNHIFVMLKIPITAKDLPMQVYAVSTYPVPVHNNTDSATQLLDYASHIAISHDETHFIELTDKQLEQCRGNRLKHCPFTMPLVSKSVPTCLSAIYHFQKHDIKQQCDFRYIHKNLKPSVIPISQEQLLITKISQIEVTCREGKRAIPACHFCIIKIPCACHVSLSHYTIRPRLWHCLNNTAEVSMVYPINTVVIQEFFGKKALAHVHGDTTFSVQPKINIPSLDVYEHKYESLIAKDKEAHLNFSRVAQAAKQKKKIYRALSEPIIDGAISYTTDYFSPLAILTYITTVMSVFSTFCCMYIVFELVNLKKLYMAIPLASTQLPGTEGSPIFSYITPTNTPMQTDAPTCTTPPLDYVLLSLSLLSIIVFCIICIWKRFRQKNHTSLNIELSNGTQCTLIKVISLPLCPRYHHFQARKYISEVNVEGIFRPKLVINWEGLQITNQMTKTVLQPPSEIAINWVQAFLAYYIIKSNFCAFSVLKHHEQSFHFLICPLDCNSCNSPTNNQTNICPTLPNEQ